MGKFITGEAISGIRTGDITGGSSKLGCIRGILRAAGRGGGGGGELMRGITPGYNRREL